MSLPLLCMNSIMSRAHFDLLHGEHSSWRFLRPLPPPLETATI